MTVEITHFDIESYEAVLALWRQCEGVGVSDADSKESIQAYLARNPQMSFVAVRGGEVVGAVLGGHDGRRGYVHHLAVAAAHRRKGIARQLVDRCLAALAAAGIRKCHLFIYRGNAAALAFWEAIGWTARSDIGVVSRSIGNVNRNSL